MYGAGAEAVALATGRSPAKADAWLRRHRAAYPRYWGWREGVITHARLHGHVDTVFGWRLHAGQDATPRALANLPTQGNGAEMLRIAACLATEAGLTVCGPVHDAFLVEGPADDIDRVVDDMWAHMAAASRAVLDGFELRTDVKVYRYPERYADLRGERMWELVSRLLDRTDPTHPEDAR